MKKAVSTKGRSTKGERKIIVTEFMTLDGVMEAPHEWSFPYWNDEIAKFKHAELFGVDALLLGRVTYEGFATAWPDRKDEQGYADRINSMPKYVISTTLKKADWQNSTIIKDNLAKEVKKLKAMPGQDVLIFGSARLTQILMQQNLIDEYRLLVYPLVLGKGKRLFTDESNTNLKLVKTKPYKSGVVLLTYEPDKK